MKLKNPEYDHDLSEGIDNPDLKSVMQFLSPIYSELKKIDQNLSVNRKYNTSFKTMMKSDLSKELKEIKDSIDNALESIESLRDKVGMTRVRK